MKNEGKTHGQCIRCSPNCRYGKCIGPRPDQCTECNSPAVMGKNALPNSTAGTCTRCADTCKESKCVGERSDECTECNADRSLVLNPTSPGNGTKDHGQCHSCASNCR